MSGAPTPREIAKEFMKLLDAGEPFVRMLQTATGDTEIATHFVHLRAAVKAMKEA